MQNMLRVWLWGTGIAQASQTPSCAAKPPGHLLSPSPIGSDAASLGTIAQPEQRLLATVIPKRKSSPKYPTSYSLDTLDVIRSFAGTSTGIVGFFFLFFSFFVFLCFNKKVLKIETKRVWFFSSSSQLPPKQECSLPSKRMDRGWSSQVWWKCLCPQQGLE